MALSKAVREYRGRNPDNGEWVYGSLIVLDDEWVYIVPPHAGASTMSKIKLIELNMKRVDPSTVCKYTGKSDKNNVRVFEGDIVKTKYGRLCVVVWFNPKLCYGLKPLNNDNVIQNRAPDKWDLWYPENLEVIGNIYDQGGETK